MYVYRHYAAMRWHLFAGCTIVIFCSPAQKRVPLQKSRGHCLAFAKETWTLGNSDFYALCTVRSLFDKRPFVCKRRNIPCCSVL